MPPHHIPFLLGSPSCNPIKTSPDSSHGGSIASGNALPQMDTASRRSLFISVMSYSFFPPQAYLFMGLALSWLFFQKLKHHKSMLDALAQTEKMLFFLTFCYCIGWVYLSASHISTGHLCQVVSWVDCVSNQPKIKPSTVYLQFHPHIPLQLVNF